MTNFQFENKGLDWCSGPNDRQVFFNINNDLSYEAIAFVFERTPDTDDFLIGEETELSIPLNSENQVIYRTFDSEVDNDYFCNEIPPISPDVLEEYRSTSGGKAIITSTLRNLEDLDRDGVPTAVEDAVTAEIYIDELPDTDGDGIENYLDTDDDGDNVPTRVEISDNIETENTVGGFPDTDADGIPNYLDPNDDNDEILTIFEDWNENQNPGDDTNDENLPHYLNPEIEDPFDAEPRRINDITIGYRYEIYIDNLTLARQDGEGEQIRLDTYVLGFIDSGTETRNLFDALDEEEENEEEEEPIE